MIRKIELKDKAEYIKMATDFYNSTAVLYAVPHSHFEDTFAELMKSDVYTETFILSITKILQAMDLLQRLTHRKQAVRLYGLKKSM